jgi:hypothetical protein
MNPKINKITDEIERTKAKIAELQALLPELERRRVEMENAEIIRLVRSASVAPADLPAFLEALKTSGAPAAAITNTPAPEAFDSDAGDEKTTFTEEDEPDA